MSAPNVRTVEQFTGYRSEATEFVAQCDEPRAELEIRVMELEQELAETKAELRQLKTKQERRGW